MIVLFLFFSKPRKAQFDSFYELFIKVGKLFNSFVCPLLTSVAKVLINSVLFGNFKHSPNENYHQNSLDYIFHSVF